MSGDSPAHPPSNYPSPGQARNETGLTIRQYAAIHLKVPQSGLAWLDDMIMEARKHAAAVSALRSLTEGFSVSAYGVAGTPANAAEIVSKAAWHIAEQMGKV